MRLEPSSPLLLPAGCIAAIEPREKFTYDRERAFRLLNVRRVPAIFQDLDIQRRAGALRERLHLPDRPVWVIPALDRNDGIPDRGDKLLDVPGLEARVEPGAVP